MPLNETLNHRTHNFVKINIKKLQSRVPELSYFGDTLKKQHLRKLEIDTESQTEVEKEERQKIKEVLRKTNFPLAPEPQWRCSSVGRKRYQTRVKRNDRLEVLLNSSCLIKMSSLHHL